jgi:hypothetical protein
MTYEETRDEEQLRILDIAIDEFKLKRSKTASRPTVIFFPGGLASKLKRATTRFDAPRPFDYGEIWLSPWTFGHPDLNALKLAMHKDDQDHAYHDEDDRIIIADGSIEFAGVTPYDDFKDWCEHNGIDLFIFGWDWRRPLDDIVKFFVEKFLPHFQERVMQGGNPDPLKDFTLMGHSFGGMIVNLILRKKDKLADQMKKAITVATPFYGYGGQIHRWFEGEDLLNHLGKKDLIRTFSSLPASYTLNWLDEKTFNDNQNAFNEDPFKLQDYPSLDLTNRTKRADPYNPQNQDGGPKVRYPRNLGFDLAKLHDAQECCRTLAAELSEDLKSKFFNIRGVQLTLTGSVNKLTIVNTTWDFIDPDFDPNAGSPITDVLGEGDQVLAAWTTHLLGLPKDNRITVQDVLHHSFILSSTEVQKTLGALLGVKAPAVRSSSLPVEEFAHPDKAAELQEEAREFVRDLHDFLQDPRRGFPHVEATVQKEVAEFLDRLRDFRRDPQGNLPHADAIFGDVLGAVAAARGMIPEKSRSIARQIMMSLCK